MVMSGTELVGILSERDYARKGICRATPQETPKSAETMTSPVISVTLQQTVDDCMNMMTQGHFRHLPVLDGDRVVGIISIGDMVKWVISGQEHAIQALEGYITGAYPGEGRALTAIASLPRKISAIEAEIRSAMVQPTWRAC